jgi:arsenite methyltransferase
LANPGVCIHPGGLALSEHSLAVCSLPVGARVIDLGCGTGATLNWLSAQGYRAVGLDASFARANLSRQNQRNALQGLGERLPFAKGSISAVIAECVLSITRGPETCLQEIRRVLAPGGWLAINDLYAREGGAAHDVGGWTGIVSQARMTAAVERAGFNVILWEDHSDQLDGSTRRLDLSCLPWFQGDALDQFLALAHCRPGYCVLVAQSRADG